MSNDHVPSSWKSVHDACATKMPEGSVRQDVMIPNDSFQPKYISPIALIRRMNEAFRMCWSDEIVEIRHAPDDSQVMVRVRVVAHLPSPVQQGAAVEVVHEAWGQARLKRNAQGMYHDYIYDVKAAHTDGIRKAATKFGIGLEVYEKDESAFQGLPRLPIPPQDMQRPAPGFMVDNVVAVLEGVFRVPRQTWLQQFGLTGPEKLTVGTASEIVAGTHPYVIALNGGAPFRQGAMAGSNA